MENLYRGILAQNLTPSLLSNMEGIFLFLLLLPIVVTIIGFMRYVVGIRTLNIYTPIILTFTFLEISLVFKEVSVIKGGLYGVFMFLLTVLSSIVIYTFLKRLRMHYIPKFSIVITAVCLVLIIAIFTFASINLNGIILITPFSLVMLATISEGVMSMLAKKNLKLTIFISFETLIISILCFLIISVEILQRLLIDNPWLIIFVLIINVFVGRYLGLRLTEYWRFRTLLKEEDNLEEKTDENNRKNSNK